MNEKRSLLLRWSDFREPLTASDVFARLPMLETPRLILRPMKMSDAQDIFAYSKDPEVARHVLWEAHRSISDARLYLRYMLRQYRNGLPSSYGIILKETGRLVGTIGFMWYNEEHASTEVGYSLARHLWNQGLMTEALGAVLDMAFDLMHVNRVEAMHDAANPASGRVMEKCGMRREGTLRQKVFNKGRYVDVALYAIVAKDRQ
ncbi:MAG: GNAT family N-acetyltransferase [Clostridia bacterium]|nr:GNAT family N-acetyltransferase [Clostridia bacterium]